jgi:3-oxoacyl-[acyl-carrier-protein] synthase II
MAARRWNVAVTGIGLVTPLGLNAIETVERVLRGDRAPGVDPQTGVAAAKAPAFEIGKTLRYPKNLKLMSQPVRMALLAAQDAFAASRLADSGIAPERLGAYVGSGQTGLEYDEFFKALTLAWDRGREQDFKYLGPLPTKLIDRYFSLRTLANAGVGALSTEFNARGPSNNYVQGEVAPAVAIHSACYDLLEDRCDAAIVCGYESLLVPAMVAAFGNVGLLSGGGFDASYAPFDATRKGIVLGEGAACLILERRADADRRGVTVLGEIDHVGLVSQTADEELFTGTESDLRDVAREAGDPESLTFVVARGLGTELDDLRESQALSGLLNGTPVSALKGQTGYLGAATAAVELGIGLLCARKGWLPCVATLDSPDPRIHLNLVRNAPVQLTGAPEGMFFSSTFGGQIAAIRARAFPAQDEAQEHANG